MTAQHTRLGSSDLAVFPLSLGGNVFGWTADRDTSFDVLDAYVAGGGNFDAAPFEPAVPDYYLTNPIARASGVMAECSRLYTHGGATLQAAE